MAPRRSPDVSRDLPRAALAALSLLKDARAARPNILSDRGLLRWAIFRGLHLKVFAYNVFCFTRTQGFWRAELKVVGRGRWPGHREVQVPVRLAVVLGLARIAGGASVPRSQCWMGEHTPVTGQRETRSLKSRLYWDLRVVHE